MRFYDLLDAAEGVPLRFVWVVEGGAAPVKTVLREPDVTVPSRVERGVQNSGPALFERKSLPSRQDYAPVSESECTRMCFVVGILAPLRCRRFFLRSRVWKEDRGEVDALLTVLPFRQVRSE